MRSCLLSFLSIVLSAGWVTVSGQSQLSRLYHDHQYFALRDAVVNATVPDTLERLFYQAIVANRFNRLQESTELLERYLGTRTPLHARAAYENLADNFVRTYQYGKAADTFRLLIDRFGKSLSRKAKADYENSFGLWDPLRDTPAQRVSIRGDITVQGTRDTANLLNLSVEAGSENLDFVFDTGANISTITVSTARRLNLKIIETSVSVGSSSNIKVKSRLAVAPKISIGKIEFYNVVFLVLDDRALHFPEIKYQINGIIGFPVIEAFGRLTISRSNSISVSDRTDRTETVSNLALENLKPVLNSSVGGKSMIFLLDTGAASSTFYPPYFRYEQARILQSATRKRMHLGGAGGSQVVTSYVLPNLEIAVGGQTARFPGAEIIAEPVNEESRHFYGNLGQDLVQQFAKMTLDFHTMSISFE
jgi:hypothetical protein